MQHFEQLSNLKNGQRGIISRYTDSAVECKLLSMGILPGKSIEIIRRVPFGGGLYLKIDTINLAVREEEAQKIILEM
jgi:ferrous iron transport protein A